MKAGYLSDEHMRDFEWIGALRDPSVGSGPPRFNLQPPTASPLCAIVGGIVCVSALFLLLRRRSPSG